LAVELDGFEVKIALDRGGSDGREPGSSARFREIIASAWSGSPPVLQHRGDFAVVDDLLEYCAESKLVWSAESCAEADDGDPITVVGAVMSAQDHFISF
jgi:hypothetical protein